jgi:hypothetical protein
MSQASEAMLGGLPARARRLLAKPPALEKMLLELSVTWPGLAGGIARMAAAARVFVITWDPLAGMVEQPIGFATTNGGSADLEIVVYVPMWSLVRTAARRNSTLASVLCALAGSAIVAASRLEDVVNAGRYPDLAARRELPDLLSDPAASDALGAATITAVSVEWQPIGLGTITDVVQQAFGPVDLDRSPVELAAVTAVHRGCLACAGGRFGFPGELAESRATMCPTHLRQAESVISRRLGAANASNPDGWAAIAAASMALGQPHLPDGLASRLPPASSSIYVIPAPDELAARATAIVDAARWFPGRPDDFAAALGQKPELAGQWPDWLANLILDLGAAGLGSSAKQVRDALGRIDPRNQALFDADVSIALAESGLADEARDQITTNLVRWPHDLWVRMHAGDALVALGDAEGAVEHFDAALRMADESEDFEAAAEVSRRLRKATRCSASEHSGRDGQREQPKRKLSKAQRQRQGRPKPR